MGYYFSLARFINSRRAIYLILAFFLPFVFHGLYDFLLMGNSPVLLTVFIPLFIYFWISGFKKMSIASDASSFRRSSDDDVVPGNRYPQ
jgi:RsiW-degrading membrane proteinase PrsW (M82 family)